MNPDIRDKHINRFCEQIYYMNLTTPSEAKNLYEKLIEKEIEIREEQADDAHPCNFCYENHSTGDIEKHPQCLICKDTELQRELIKLIINWLLEKQLVT